MSLFFIDPYRTTFVDPGDPYFINTKLITHFDAYTISPAVQNFAGSGTSTVVTQSPAVLSATQAKFGAQSASFPSGFAYIQLTDFAQYNLDTPSWTWELWYYETTGSLGSLVNHRFNATGWVLTTTGIRAYINGAWSDSQMSWAAMPQNQWNHIVWQKTGTTLDIYLNGVKGTPKTNVTSISYIGATAGVQMGLAGGGENPFRGYMDDTRFTAGVARYTSNFTPPTVPFPNVATASIFGKVSLLMHMDGTNGSTTFTDNSSNGLTVTANGGAAISTAQSKFGGASGYFDGTGDYLSIPTNAVMQLTGDFTVEFWCRLPSTVLGGIMDNGAANFGVSGAFLISANYPGTPLQISLFREPARIVDTAALTLDTWHHIAFVRSGTTVTAYKDGVASATGTLSTTLDLGLVQTRIGKYWGADLNGYIDDLRITKNLAVYTANFTPPTAAFPNS